MKKELTMVKTSAALIGAVSLLAAVSAHAQGSATPTQGNPPGTAAPSAPATNGAAPATRTAPSEALGGRNPAGITNPDRTPASTQDHEPASK
jgi:hypothetical protein